MFELKSANAEATEEENLKAHILFEATKKGLEKADLLVTDERLEGSEKAFFE